MNRSLLKSLLRNSLSPMVVVACAFALGAPSAEAGVGSKAVSETVEFVSKKFAKETAEEGLEVLTKKIEVFATKYGDDGLEAVRKLGPNAMRVAGETGEHSATAIRAMAKYGDDGVVWIAKRPEGLELASKYGDDAAEALVKHKEIAEPLIKEGGEAAAKALKAVDPQHARTLARLAADPVGAPLAKNVQLLDVVAKYGDNAVQYIWRNKGKLAVGTVLAAFLANPKPFIDGATDLSQAAVRPVSDAAADAVRGTNVTLVAIALVLIGGCVAGWTLFLRHRARLLRSKPAGP